MRAIVLSLLLIAALAVDARVRCGDGLPTCPNSKCCSADGLCGTGPAFCRNGCQAAFGRCRPPKTTPTTTSYPTVTDTETTDTATLTPTTTSTQTSTPTSVSGNQRPPRPQGGAPANVITKCTVPGTVAITFDDGPADTTHLLLDVLARYPDVHVTFFINGLNYVDASLPEYQAVISRAFQSGHQIASHTFQHKDLATLSDADITDQMVKNDNIIYSATGRIPRYMRPPYGSTNAQALTTLGGMGFVVIDWNVDTMDWSTNDAQQSASVYEKTLASSLADGFIVLDHDTMSSTANNLMDLVIPAIRSHNLRMVTVAECLGDSQPYL